MKALARKIRSLPIALTLSLFSLVLFIFIALFAPYLANKKPIYIEIGDESWYPIWEDLKVIKLKNGKNIPCNYTSLRHIEEAYIIWPIATFSPGEANLDGDPYPPPGTVVNGRTYYLGGTNIGADILAGVIHGARVSLLVGIASMLIALCIGLFFGIVSAYAGNNMLKASMPEIVIFLLFALLGWYYAFQVRHFVIVDALKMGFVQFIAQLLISLAIFLFVCLIGFSLSRLMAKRFSLKRKALPADHLIGRFMDFFTSLPRLILLITVSAIAKPSIYTLILIIGFAGWVGIARYTRAEVLKLRNSDFLNACRIMGMSHRRIVIRHLLPNALGPALVAFTFGVAGAILSESSLSYLGIGIPHDITTWGKLLNDARYNFNAWWMVLFPGLAIFILLLSVNTIGEYLKEKINPAISRA